MYKSIRHVVSTFQQQHMIKVFKTYCACCFPSRSIQRTQNGHNESENNNEDNVREDMVIRYDPVEVLETRLPEFQSEGQAIPYIQCNHEVVHEILSDVEQPVHEARSVRPEPESALLETGMGCETEQVPNESLEVKYKVKEQSSTPWKNMIFAWEESLALLSYLENLFKKPDFIYVDDKFHTLDIEFGTIFDEKYVCMWLSNWGGTAFTTLPSGEVDFHDIYSSTSINCEIMFFKGGDMISDFTIPFNVNNMRPICKKLKKLL